MEAGHTTRMDLHLLETVRLRLALDLPPPPATQWNLTVSSCLPGSTRIDFDKRATAGHEDFEFEFVDPVHAEIILDSHLSGWPQLYQPGRDLMRGAHVLQVAFRAGRIEGRVAESGVKAGRVTLSWKSGALGAWAEASVDDTGHFVFECAPAGECTLEREGEPGSARGCVVKPGETTSVEGM